jgi:hypothetical protein
MRYIFTTFSLFIIVVLAHCQKDDENKAAATMKVNNYEGYLHIDFFDKDKNMQISFNRCGINQLFSIAKVSYYSTLSDHYQKHPSNEFSSCTDWIGPYYVSGTSSVSSGLSQKFTGGWHGSNGDGTGAPTAQTVNVSLSIDGETSTGNFEHDAKQVDIFVSNLIHGYDFVQTNKTLIKENVHYTIKSNRQIDVEVQIEALEDLVIQRYYGLQSQNFAIFDSVKYMTMQNQVINTESINKNSSCRSNNELNTVLLTDNENIHRLKMVLNMNEGLGAVNNLGAGTPRAFSANYRKSYFNLVNGRDLMLRKGGTTFWKGSYFWD